MDVNLPPVDPTERPFLITDRDAAMLLWRINHELQDTAWRFLEGQLDTDDCLRRIETSSQVAARVASWARREMAGNRRSRQIFRNAEGTVDRLQGHRDQYQALQYGKGASRTPPTGEPANAELPLEQPTRPTSDESCLIPMGRACFPGPDRSTEDNPILLSLEGADLLWRGIEDHLADIWSQWFGSGQEAASYCVQMFETALEQATALRDWAREINTPEHRRLTDWLDTVLDSVQDQLTRMQAIVKLEGDVCRQEGEALYRYVLQRNRCTWDN